MTTHSTGRPSTPQEASSSLLWALYTTLPIPHEIVDFPVPPSLADKMPPDVARIAIVPLPLEEQMAAQSEADEYARRCMKDRPPKEGEANLAFQSIYEKEVALRILYRVCRDPNDPTLQRKTFPGPKYMRLMLTPDQVSILTYNYIRAERMLSPIKSDMSEAEMDALITKLREGARSFPLDWIGSEALKDLVMHLALQTPTSAMPSGSPGSPPGSSTSAPDDPPPMLPSEEPPVQQLSDPLPHADVDADDAPKLVLG